MIIFSFSQISKVLILSGSHGSEDGISGISDKDKLEYEFYRDDCELLGIKSGPHKRRLPLTNWNGVPDITKPAEKDDNFVPDKLLKDMDIRVCNICYYHGKQEKFVQDVQEVSFMNRVHGLLSSSRSGPRSRSRSRSWSRSSVQSMV